MKYIVALFIVLVLASSNAEEWKPKTSEEIKTIRAECVAEHQLGLETIEKMKRFEFPDEEPVRQYLLCSAVKLGIFCEHEGYHADRIAKQFKMDLDESKVLEIATGCIDKNEQNSPKDVWAFRGHKCLMDSEIGQKVRNFIKKKQEAAQQATA